MNAVHPTPHVLELYVLGADDEIAVAEIEGHLGACESCTEEVRRQAHVEMALEEVVAAGAFCPGCEAALVTSTCASCGAMAEAGGFRIEKVLVQNAHGRMYLARAADGRAVALKELAFVQAPRPEAVEAFEREARLLRQLEHPQIPRFLGSFRLGEGISTRFYLAQEYVEGESLAERLKNHQFTEAEALDIGLQVLSILEYLQGLSPMVFHRDIKPANLVRRHDGRIALVDFGAARDLGSTVGATLVGTFGYMPVEQMGGIVDATTDLYALGATLGHLLSRREPWKFIEDPQALDRLSVSRGFRAGLARLLARQPRDRFPSAITARQALLSGRLPRRPLGLPLGGQPLSLSSGLLVGAMTAVLAAGAALFFRPAAFKHTASAPPAPAVIQPPPAPTPDRVVDIEVGDAPTKGPEGAPVTIIVFSDFQCPFCSRAVATLKRIEDTYKDRVRIAFKHLPLPFHREAEKAARASMAAHEQGKFWPMHDKLFANQHALHQVGLVRYAQELGLDGHRFEAALESQKVRDYVAQDAALAGRLGITGTPTFVVNRRVVVGAQPFEVFKKVIDEELSKK